MTIDGSKNLDRLFKPKPGELVVVCAWCGKEIRRKSGDEQTGISHGICEECLTIHFPEQVKKGGSRE